MNSLYLDIFTVNILLAIGNLISFFLYLGYTNFKLKEKIDYIYLCSKSLGLLGWLLIGLRYKIPFFISFDIGNMITLLGIILESLCFISVKTKISNKFIKYTFIFLLIDLIIWFSSIAYLNVETRILIITLPMIIFYLIVSFIFLKPSDNTHYFHKLIGFLYLINFLITFSRALFLLTSYDYDLLKCTLYQGASYIINYIFIFVSSIGYVLLRKQLIDIEAKIKTKRLEEEIIERIKIQKQLEELAFLDHLTQLPNRKLFQEHLKHSIDLAFKNNTALSVLFIDLDGFKEVNDTFGHDQGDLVLKIISKRLKDSVRINDIVARLGGDEFTILLDTLSDKVSLDFICNKILKELTKPIPLNTNTICITASIGISTFPNDSETPLGLIKKADCAMYKAKSTGKNTYFFSSNL